MANRATVNQHVEQSEYAKEKARLTAGGILAGLDVHELLTDPQAYVDDVLAAFLISIDSTLDDALDQAASYAGDLGLGHLSDSDLEDIKQRIREHFVTGAPPALSDRLNDVHDSLAAMLDDGVSEDTILKSLESD